MPVHRVDPLKQSCLQKFIYKFLMLIILTGALVTVGMMLMDIENALVYGGMLLRGLLTFTVFGGFVVMISHKAKIRRCSMKCIFTIVDAEMKQDTVYDHYIDKNSEGVYVEKTRQLLQTKYYPVYQYVVNNEIYIQRGLISYKDPPQIGAQYWTFVNPKDPREYYEGEKEETVYKEAILLVVAGILTLISYL